MATPTIDQIAARLSQKDNIVVESAQAQENWAAFGDELKTTKGQPRQMKPLLEKANGALADKQFFDGEKLGQSDLHVWAAISDCGKENKGAVAIIKQFANLQKWKTELDQLTGLIEIFKEFYVKEEPKKETKKPANKKEGGLNLGHSGGYLKLENVDKVDKVITRFPPEPSGYLHIGHAKAAFLNYHYAQQYNGRLIVRFDDTNPRKEKEEYEHEILNDLKTLGIPLGDKVTYTSDYFEQIEQYAIQIIKQGDAYVDNAPVEVIRAARMDGKLTPAFDNSIEENLRLFDEMRNATEEGVKCILRARILDGKWGPMQNPNKALRDPALYRTVTDAEHNRTGNKYKAYPLYDFACPIVDSIEGVTHALRSNEYHDRNPLFYWVLEKCGLRKVYIEDYSRLNFSYSVMSKRKLQKFVDSGKVSGWNDPSFPTVQGFLRRGLSVDAIKAFVISQGSSKAVNLMDINKLWAVNKQVIDPTAERYTAIDRAGIVVSITNFTDDLPTSKSVPKHKQNPALGEKTITFSDSIIIDRADADSIADDEEVTLMDWGNFIARKVNRDESGRATSITGELHLAGNFKTTKKKLTWLNNKGSKINVIAKEFDNLITVPKIPKDGNFDDFVTPQIEKDIELVGDANISNIKKGQIIQFERRGYFICDVAFTEESGQAVFIVIPDGKAAPKAEQAKAPAKQ